MDEEKELSTEVVEEMILELMQTALFTTQEQEILAYHFGLGGRDRKKPREIGRLCKLPLKRAELEVKRLETKVFNLLKTR